ncbi:ATP-binding cassette domain-containing protein [Fusobacterium sp.]|uniref:ATP-binding cassette domain-containing protein n=1 Tax=Fusobacterium sp. TaxID=68766 RepID=UPI002904369F|nr:ATP-binding cassette domain-containing protein [Fusobacterium sp.]MDU1911672.1 ATP-binding cassette domain-containing protein [Fusobacterium sp.]
MNNENVVIAENLYKYFIVKPGNKKVEALTNINIEIPVGKLTALIGPDGAGKTTFMRLVCGLMMPSEGNITVLGINTKENPQEIQNRISYMPQRFGLYEDLSIQENLNLYADLYGVPKEIRNERFERLLKMTGLEDFTERQTGKLSGGMKQKLGLICTLVRSPELLLLDEPTVGVDPLSRRELWEILQKLVKEENITVLVNTAYMDEAELCHKVIVIHKSTILATGTPKELSLIGDDRCFKIQPPSGMPSRILQTKLLDDKQNIIDAVPEGDEVRFITYLDEAFNNIKEIDSNLQIQKVDSTLEDGFMILLREYESKHTKTEKKKFPIKFSDKFEISKQVDIEVKNLVRKFGDFTAVSNTSFQVYKGEIFGLLGPNGAGKTTTFRMLCGLLPSTSGFLSVAGVNLRNSRTYARTNIGYVAQKFSLYSNLTVEENLMFFGGVYGLKGDKLKNRIEEVKKQFDLIGQETKTSGELPGGFKQRLSMAVALLHEPKILFLDEPTSGIDPLARRTFWRQITALAAGGTTIIITTHFLEEAEYCDRIMIQDQGKMLIIGTPKEVRESAGENIKTMNQAFIEIVEQNRSKE